MPEVIVHPTSIDGGLHESLSDDESPQITYSQKYYAGSVFHPGSVSSSTFELVEITGKLSRRALETALQLLADRHDSLRLRFFVDEKQRVRMVPTDPFTAGLEYIDLGRAFCFRREEKLRKAIYDFRARRFNITVGPAYRALLVRSTKNKHILVLVFHHIVCDGLSAAIVRSEIPRLYAGAIQGPKAQCVAARRNRFSEFARWQQRWLGSRAASRHIDYWRSRLDGASSEFPLKPDSNRPQSQNGAVKALRRELTSQTVRGLRELGTREKVPLWIVIMASCAIILREWSRQDDLLVWCVHSGRMRADLLDVVGCFAELWPLRLKISQGASVADAIASIRTGYVEALPNIRVPYEVMRSLLPLSDAADSRRSIQFNYIPHVGASDRTRNVEHLNSSDSLELPTMREPSGVFGRLSDAVYIDHSTALYLEFYEVGDVVILRARCSLDLFSEATIEWFGNSFVSVLSQALEQCHRPATVPDRPAA